MKSTPQKRVARALFVLGAVSFLPCCGVQGPPHPPRVEEPQRITDLDATQLGNTFTFTFTAPQLAVDGEGLTKPVEVELYRAIVPAGTPISSITPPRAPWLDFLPEYVTKHTADDKTSISATIPSDEYDRFTGSTLIFTARALTRGFRHRAIRGEPSNAVVRTLLDVSPPVQDLRVATTEKAVVLHWTPPGRGLSGKRVSGLKGYRIYRSAEPAPSEFHLLGESGSPSYSDSGFEFGKTYFYKVRALFERDKQTAESEDSDVVKITPKDIFPPAPPVGLSALYVSGAVEVVWTANSEPDLAGYNVYRREENGLYAKVNQSLVLSPVFRDASAAPGRKYTYQITAVDLSGNESGRSQEVSVETQ